MTKAEMKRVDKAARVDTKGKLGMAEALALDIPDMRGKDGGALAAMLERAREVIIDAGGETRSVNTLRNYRKTARWVANESVNRPISFDWVQGVSYTAHEAAMNAGISLADFKAEPKTARQIRVEAGGKSKDGTPANYYDGLPDEQKMEMGRLVHADHDRAQRLYDEPEVRTNSTQDFMESNKRRTGVESDVVEEAEKVAADAAPKVWDADDAFYDLYDTYRPFGEAVSKWKADNKLSARTWSDELSYRLDQLLGLMHDDAQRLHDALDLDPDAITRGKAEVAKLLRDAQAVRAKHLRDTGRYTDDEIARISKANV